MAHLLQEQVRAVGHRIRRLLFLYGACYTFCFAVTLLLVIGFIDWGLHQLQFTFIDDRGIRILVTLFIALSSSWCFWKFVVRPQCIRLSDIHLARWVETRYPQLRDSLTSAIYFLENEERNVLFGSDSLRQAVISKTTHQLENLNLKDVLETFQIKRAVVGALTAISVSVAIAYLSPIYASRALARITNPFSTTPWPKQTEIKLLKVSRRVVKGDPFHMEVQVKSGLVPRQSFIDYQLPAPTSTITTAPLMRNGSILKATRKSPQSSFDVRIRAGDDLIDWQNITVIDPPRLETLQAQLFYPPYTHKEPETLAVNRGNIDALPGTRVLVHGSSNKPLRSAALTVNGHTTPIVLNKKSLSMATEFTVNNNGSYSLSLTDREPEAFNNHRSRVEYEIQTIPDLMPEVTFEEPTSHQQVTAHARVPLRIMTRDDWGIATITLRYQQEDTATDIPSSILLYDQADRPLQKSTDFIWHLDQLPLNPGSTLHIHAEATDYDNINGPHTGKSELLRLEIVSEQAILDQVSDQQTSLKHDLQRLLQMQELAQGQIRDLQRQITFATRLTSPDIDTLESAETAQQHVSRGLTNHSDGALGRIQQLSDKLQINRINDPETQTRLETMSNLIRQLQETSLPTIEQELVRARKASINELSNPSSVTPTTPIDNREQSDSNSSLELPQNSLPSESRTPTLQTRSTVTPPSPSIKPSSYSQTTQTALGRVETHQQEVIASIETMLGDVSAWADKRELLRDIDELINSQKKLLQETSSLTQQASESFEKGSQQEATLQRLAGRQMELSSRTQRSLRKLEIPPSSTADSKAIAPDAFKEAADFARNKALTETMHQAAEHLSNQRMGQALQTEQESLTHLEALKEVLNDDRDKQLSRLAKQLREAEQQLEGIRTQQKLQRDKTQQATTIGESKEHKNALEALRKSQQNIQKSTRQLSAELHQIDAFQAGQSTQQAAVQMTEADQLLEQNKTEPSIEQQENALQSLEIAQKQLADARRRAESQRTLEQFAQLQNQIATVRKRQNAIYKQTEQLQLDYSEQGRWTRRTLKILRQSTQEQNALRQQADRLTEQLTGAPVFHLSLSGATRKMDDAAQRLSDRKTDSLTQNTQQEVISRLTDILNALQATAADKSANHEGNASESGGGQGGGSPANNGIPPVTQLRLLKSLQQGVNNRTRVLDQSKDQNPEMGIEDDLLFDQLSEEQGQIADLLMELLRPTSD